MKQKTTILRLILIVLVIGLVTFIFLLSNQPAMQSSNLSNSIASYTLPFIDKICDSDLTLKEWDHMLRKLAHFSLFFFLAIIVVIICKLSRFSWRRASIITLLISMGYAIVDESHQLFVVGRGASMRDVAIDSAGAIIGIVVVFIVGRRWLK